MKDVLIFFGGVSQEHDISVISGVFTTNAVDKILFNPIPVFIKNNGEWFTGEPLKNISFYKSYNEKLLKKVTLVAGDNTLYEVVKNKKLKKIASPCCAINALHGRNGEDGTLYGLLKLCNIPLASPNAFSSAVAIDKCLTKSMLAPFKIKCVPSITVHSVEFFADREKIMLGAVNELNYPLIVKPAKSGSSIGIMVASDFNELENAFNTAFQFDEKVIVEKFLLGATEINCAVYGGMNGIVVSECDKPITKNEFLTFEDKYLGTKGGQKREFPAKIPVKTSALIKEISKTVYETFDFFGIIRIDYLIFDGEVYLNEINSVPGSLAYYFFCEKISDFSKILTELIVKKIAEYSLEKSTLHEYAVNVLLNEIQGVKK